VLKQKGPLTGQTAIIHGTAFGEVEFQQMADVGAHLIWSPESNLVLYGQTTDIKRARQHGISVSLGVDWHATGSDTVFDELRVAAQVNDEIFEHAIPPSEWVRMITINPAKALALESQVGKLAAGLKADLTVLKAHDPDPSQSLLKTHVQDVEMVWVGGEVLYGTATVLEILKPGLCEPLIVYGARKRICVVDTKDPVEKTDQSLAAIQSALQANYTSLAPLAP
jgi:5-methylthioadenosine/S-adenosylhomocysteine deaminase